MSFIDQWRDLASVKKAIALKEPSAANLAISLDPDDLRKGRSIVSPGTAHLYAPKTNDSYQERLRCRYRTNWSEGLKSYFQMLPSEVIIENCEHLPSKEN